MVTKACLLPFVFAGGLVEDVFLAIDGQDTVL